MDISNYRFVEPSNLSDGPCIPLEEATKPGKLIELSVNVGGEGMVIPVATRRDVENVLRMLVPPGTSEFPSSFASAGNRIVTLHQGDGRFGKVPFTKGFTEDPTPLPQDSYLRISASPRVLNPKKPGTLWKTAAGQPGELPIGTDPNRVLTPKSINEPGQLQFEPTVVNDMALLQWSPDETRWTNQILPEGELGESPWTTERHYKGGILTGIRAWTLGNDGIYVFRPDEHAARFDRDAKRLGYPGTSPEMFRHAMKVLLEANREWVPTLESGACAYVRFYGFNSTTGIRIKGGHWEIHGLATPVGPYMPSQLNAVYTGIDRPVPPGFGDIKSGLCYRGPALELGKYAGGKKPYHEAIFGKKKIQEGLSAGIAAVFYEAGKNGRDLIVFADGKDVLPSIMHRSAEAWLRAHPDRFEVQRGTLTPRKLARANEVIALGTAAFAAEIVYLDGPGRFEDGKLVERGETLFDRGRKPDELGPVTYFVRSGFERMTAKDPSLPAPFSNYMQRMA